MHNRSSRPGCTARERASSGFGRDDRAHAVIVVRLMRCPLDRNAAGDGDDYSLLADAHLHNEHKARAGQKSKQTNRQQATRLSAEHVMRVRAKSGLRCCFTCPGPPKSLSCRESMTSAITRLWVNGQQVATSSLYRNLLLLLHRSFTSWINRGTCFCSVSSHPSTLSGLHWK
jgi:hypothetical protein